MHFLVSGLLFKPNLTSTGYFAAQVLKQLFQMFLHKPSKHSSMLPFIKTVGGGPANTIWPGPTSKTNISERILEHLEFANDFNIKNPLLLVNKIS